MSWKCKYCGVYCEKRGQMLKHYRLKHGHFSRSQPFPCPHDRCLCTFKSLGTLKTHLSRVHSIAQSDQAVSHPQIRLRCQLCEFCEPCLEADYFTHIRKRHLINNQRVQCPFKGCSFESSVYSTFNAHKSKQHRDDNWRLLKPELVENRTENEGSSCSNNLDQVLTADNDLDYSEETTESISPNLLQDLEHNLAALFLKMQAILHIPESSVQEVIQQLSQLAELSHPLLYKKVKSVLQKHHVETDELVIKELIDTVTESNVLSVCCGKDGSQATIKRRGSYVMREFPLVMPIEYVVEQCKKTVAYVPVLQMLQKLLRNRDIFKKITSQPDHVSNEYNSWTDGKCYLENKLLCNEEFTIALNLYIDDFEVANPLGTSRGKHKMCAVYWTIANLPLKYRSTLNSIQLALLCNTTTIKEHGYDKALYPLISDLVSLEQHGVYIEHLASTVKGTVFCVSADNLGAHSLAGFHESFSVDKCCRFCLASKANIQIQEMSSLTLMRVFFTEGDIRRISIEKPTSVEELISVLKQTLEIEYNFSLPFRDPEFDNELCNLTDVADLPERPTLKIIPVLDLVPVVTTDSLDDSVSTADTELLSCSSQESRKPWPNEFCIPKFAVDVEYRLRQGNLHNLKDGTYLKMSKELKHDILQRLAESIYSFKAYPSLTELGAVAKALVAAHPCLKEPASPTGYCGWKNSLKDKMGNYRTKMRALGHEDVMINAGKRGRYSSDGEPPHKNIRKPKKGEVNYLPDFPDGHTTTSLDLARQVLVDEMKKKNPNAVLIKQKMDLTLALRRKEVVKAKPRVSQMVKRWPALFMESQIFQEFNRVVGRDLKREFFESLDRLTPKLIEIFRAKKGLKGQMLEGLLKQTKTSDITDSRCLVLRGLPVLLDDNPNDFFKACFVSDDEDSYLHITVGILCLEEEGATQHPLPCRLHPSSVGIILEGHVVMSNLTNLAQAMCLLFGLTYALHLNYPKCMVNTLNFIQQVMFGLGRKDLKGKILTLTNQLSM